MDLNHQTNNNTPDRRLLWRAAAVLALSAGAATLFTLLAGEAGTHAHGIVFLISH